VANPRKIDRIAPLRAVWRYGKSASVPPATQAAKLGLKPGQRVSLHDRPPGWALTDPPAGLLDADDPGEPGAPAGLLDADDPGEPGAPADVIIAFFGTAHDIAAQLGGLARRIYPAGALWVAWPRRAGGHRSDITDTVIREVALPLGLVDVKVAAIDDDWSGLRLVWRTENRTVLGARRLTKCASRGRGRSMNGMGFY
jgi:hypothetical protein